MMNVYYVECSYLGSYEERWYANILPEQIRQALEEQGRSDIQIFRPVPNDKCELKYADLILVD